MNQSDKHEMLKLFRELRQQMGPADEAAAALTADAYGITTAEVLREAFFESQPPPRKGPSAAKQSVVMMPRRREA